MALRRWTDLDGWAVSRNMPRLETLDLDRFCNFIWYRSVDGAEQKEIDKFKARLWIPPKGVVPTPDSPWSAESEASAFQSLKAGLSKK